MPERKEISQSLTNGGKKRCDLFDRNPSILSMLTKAELVDYVEALFQKEGSVVELGLDGAMLREFIQKVSRHYRENPYHNFHHAVDTVNTIGWMISQKPLADELPLHYRFLLLLTGLIHDVDHPGHNNQWEVLMESYLAKLYANEAVLEKNSLDVTSRIMAIPAYDLFLPFGRKTGREWFGIVEELVLATDFALHRDFLDQFGEYLEGHAHNFSDPVFLSWISRALIKGADIANTSKPFSEAKVWGQRVMMEFWAQGVMEKRHKFPVGPLNDPETVKLNAAQAGFIKFAALELFEQISQVVPDMQELVNNLQSNLEVYEEKARRGDGLFE